MFAATVVLSLGVGISSACGVIAVVDSMLYGRLPFGNADRVEHLYTALRSEPDLRSGDVPAVVFGAMQRVGAPVEDVAAYTVQNFKVRRGDRTVFVWGTRATPNFPELLGPRVILGRAFGPGDAGDMPAVMLSDSYWRSAFGADSTLIGKTMEIDGVPHRVVGVAAPEWDFPERTAFWTSSLDPQELLAGNRRLMVLVKLRTTGDAAPTRARMALVGNAAMQAQTYHRRNEVVSSVSFRDFTRIRLGDIITALTIIAVLIGLLTVVNYAGLILARGIRRRGELGVRAALGASIWRLARHIVGESLLLSAIGGFLAALLGPVVVVFLRRGFNQLLPAWLTISLSWRSVAASVALTVVVGVVFALGPAFDLARPSLAGFLQATNGSLSGAPGAARTRSVVVAIQVALTTAVLIALGALMGASLLMRRPNVGFDYRAVLVSYVTTSGHSTELSSRLIGLRENVRSTSGVIAAGYLEQRELDPTKVSGEDRGRSISAGDLSIRHLWLDKVGDGFFGVVTPRLIAGRLFTAEEERRGAPVTVISERAARQLFHGAVAGGRIRLGTDQPMTVVGVIADLQLGGFAPEPIPAVFTPTAASDVGAAASRVELWTRVSGSVGPMARKIQVSESAIAGGSLRTTGPRWIGESIAGDMAAYRSMAELVLGIFGVALGLAALGIYGLVAYSAEIRGRELAIRAALGAQRMHVAFVVLRDALVQTIAGAVAGSILAVAIVDYLDSYNFSLTVAGRATGVALAVIAATVLLSSAGPVRSAWRRDLARTLRV